jgi:diguanylate cyclase (GGDEF)-like protein
MGTAEVGKLDELTGLGLYEACAEALAQQTAAALETGGCVSACLVDVDMFAEINERYGSAVGDEVLRQVARTLRDAIGEQGTAFRYAGDEFMAVLPGMEKERAFLTMEAVRGAFSGTHALEAEGSEVEVPLSLSIGVACCPDDGRDWQDVARKAIDAMVRAKAGGRDRACLAREERMVTKTSHYTQGQLERLAALAAKEGVGEAVLLREALDDLLRKYTF